MDTPTAMYRDVLTGEIKSVDEIQPPIQVYLDDGTPRYVLVEGAN